jgi:hypothetical protein
MVDLCADCGTDKCVTMYNSREVRGGFLWLQVIHKTFPGFLCIPCWKLANPKLFPPLKESEHASEIH